MANSKKLVPVTFDIYINELSFHFIKNANFSLINLLIIKRHMLVAVNPLSIWCQRRDYTRNNKP